MRGTVGRASLALLVAVAACDGQSAPHAFSEPLQVRGGQFMYGDLPGTPAPDGGAPTDVDAAAPDAAAPAPAVLAVTAVQLASQFVVPGGNKTISGRASGPPFSIGVRFADMGTGYWVVPAQGVDPQFPGQLTFSFGADFNANDAPGTHSLMFTAFDSRGVAGQKYEVPLCVLSRIPDNLHECDPTAKVPSAVMSLQWDSDFDLDLHVVTPAGVDINPKSPLGVPVEAGVRPPLNATKIDRDSLGACVPDGLRQEDVVFQDWPAAGNYAIYADPFDSCGKPAVRFKLTVYQSVGTCPDCQLQPTFTRSGELLASQTTGGGSAGLFVVDYPFAN